MKNWLDNLRRRRRMRDVGSELRRSRPQASERLVRTIAGRIKPQRGTLSARRRFGVAAIAAGSTLAVLGATGGFSVAATSLIHATRSVAHVTPSGWQKLRSADAPSGFTQGTRVSFDSACDMYAVAPTITGISPEAGAPGSVIEVDGTNFTGINEVTDVEVNGDPASFRVNSSTSLQLVIPDDATTGAISIANCAGPATGPSFTVEQAPSITGTAPGDGGYGTEVVITGSGFTGTTKVAFNGMSDSSFSIDSDTQITAHVPSGAKTNTTAHPGQVVITNGVDSSGFSFIVDAGSPSVTSFVPTAGQVGTTIKIKGANFEDDSGNSLVSGVSFNGTAATPNVVSKTEVDADVPVGATSGPISVATDVGVTTSKQSFTVVAPNPSVDDLVPNYGKVGASVKIEGTSLTGIAKVLFTDADSAQTISASFKVSSDSLVTATVPRNAQTGPIELLRHDPSGGADQTGLSGDFTVITAKPQLASVLPTSGGYGTPITINAAPDSTLIGVTAVAFNGTPDKTFSVSDDGQTISATVPQHAVVKAAGHSFISVTNAGGTSTIAFDVIGDGPTIKTVTGTLANGKEAQVGDAITITGTNLDTVTRVTFGGGANVTSFVWQDTDLLTVRVPSGAETGTITVKNPDGSATSSTSLTILRAPTVLGFSPAYGRSGTKVHIVGTHLSGTTGVYFSGAPAKFTVADDNGIDAVVPANAATGAIEVIVGRRMEADSGNDEFTVVATKPTFSSYSPGTGSTGDTVTITGSRFVGPMTVKFGSKTAGFVHVSSASSITTKVPSGVSGTVSISVSNLAGTVTKSGFKVVAISSASPGIGVRDTTHVTINGTNLTAAGRPVVTIGGVSADVVTASASRVVVQVPAGARSGSITLTTGSVTVTAPGSFTVLDPPTISTFTGSGKRGTRVTINGTNFVGVKSVKFHGVTAKVTVVSSTKITAVVPSSATNGTISVTTIAGTATSGGPFTVIR